MKTLLIYIIRGVLNLIYSILKLFPVKEEKIVFLSRQENTLSTDFIRLKDMLNKKRPGIKIVSVCHRLEGNKLKGAFGFGISTLRSMYHLATGRVCVLDAYWPAISILKHKDSLKVIQMWHAIGKIKQSGYQTLGKDGGRSEKIAKLMKMHRGYDFVIAGAEAWNPFYKKSFGIDGKELRNFGLPRIDYLIESKKENQNRIYEAYPEFRGKKILLYAPTFRRNIQLKWESLYEELFQGEGGEDYILVIKGHPNQKINITDEMAMVGVKTCPDFKAVELLSVSDYLITDYSAIALEGAILRVPTLYFLYDYREYREKNGMNIDLYKEMPDCVFNNGKDLVNVIKSGEYNHEALNNYVERFLPKDLGHSTEKITDLILDCMEMHK